MNRLKRAIGAFLDAWRGEATSGGTKRVEIPEGKAGPAPVPVPAGAERGGEASGPGSRDGALTLMAALQREARFLDFVMESLDAYSDEQIGAAVRDVHRDCAAVIRRVMGPEAVLGGEEGTEVAVGSGLGPESVRWTGSVGSGEAGRGVLRHRGWRATRCDLPSWSGRSEAVWVLAAAEVEVRGGSGG